MTSSPPTTATSAARSVVVATTRVAAQAGTAASAAAAITRLKSPARTKLPGRHPGAFRHETVHGFLRSRRHGQTTIHHHAREAVRIEAAQLPVALKEL